MQCPSLRRMFSGYAAALSDDAELPIERIFPAIHGFLASAEVEKLDKIGD